MSKTKKTLPGVAIGLLLAGVLVASLWPHRGEVPVEVARVERHDLIATVRASGQILPRSYTNVLGQGFGRITDILVHEGEFVRPGDVLLKVDDVQPAADVHAQQAALSAAEAGLRVAKAAMEGAQAAVAQREADVRKARFDWEQGQKLYQAQVISKRAYEQYRSAYDAAAAALAGARSRLAATHDQEARAAGAVNQIRATLAHAEDVLSKTVYRAPISGTVTNIGVRVGENVIRGVPEATGAYLMTISDLGSVKAQVGVDENDITFLHRDQPVKLSLDAYPEETFSGKVMRVGAQAILTTTGRATTQLLGGGSAQQATDYKVDISLEQLPPGLRPGMTVNVLIQTANKKNVVAVPFQALVLRPKSEAGRTSVPRAPEAAPVEIAVSPQQKDQPAKPAGVNGVFVVRSGRAIFMPVDVGVLGENYVEAKKGVKPGEEIIVGSYTALRELHSGMRVKIVKKD